MPLEIHYNGDGIALPNVGDRVTIYRNDELVYETIISRVHQDGSYDVMSLAEYLDHRVLCANKMTSLSTVATASSPQQAAPHCPVRIYEMTGECYPIPDDEIPSFLRD